MNIYISGISGTGMGPLALMAADAGFHVAGSDLSAGAILPELQTHRIDVKIGPQDGSYLKTLIQDGKVDWFVHTSALPSNHPELILAKDAGIKVSKRDELIAYLVENLNLKMIAVAGTHGKTTTTAMIVWACRQLHIPVSYLVGTTLPFASAGHYDAKAQFFVYEADEYDRNFLYYHPWLAVITTVSYDHPDIYPTRDDYYDAFRRFISQSQNVIVQEKYMSRLAMASFDNILHDTSIDIVSERVSSEITLAGAVRRYDANLALSAIQHMDSVSDTRQIIAVLNDFPGVGRRFERIAPQVYSDYAHHPEEIRATIDIALEEARRSHLQGVVAVYQPHQNTRQHSIRDSYHNAFTGVKRLYWLPTYLTREKTDLNIITPQDFLSGLDNSDIGQPAQTDDNLATALKMAVDNGYLVVLMTAGSADAWLRKVFS